jgi:N-sulfoglucosamine sulfohydrolase
MSGQWAQVSGGIGLAHMGWPLPASVHTLVDHCNQHGVETAHFGLEHERHPRGMGYQIEGDRHWDDWWTENAVDDAITYLRSRDPSKPFFLNVGTQEVHACRFTRDEIVEGSGPGQYGGRTAADEVYIPNYLSDSERNRRVLGGFQSSIRYMDHHVGRLLAALDESPYADNTMVVFTTDHGIATDARRDKGTLWERGTEIALLIRPPKGLPRGYAVDHLLQNIDFHPTFCEALGLPIPAGRNGRSFWPLLTGSDYYHYIRAFEPGVKPEPQVWICREHDGSRPEEYLYDTKQDTMELVNLVERPEYRAVLEAMRKRLRQWMEETDDFILRGTIPEPYEPHGWGDWPVQEERTPWRPGT